MKSIDHIVQDDFVVPPSKKFQVVVFELEDIRLALSLLASTYAR